MLCGQCPLCLFSLWFICSSSMNDGDIVMRVQPFPNVPQVVSGLYCWTVGDKFRVLWRGLILKGIMSVVTSCEGDHFMNHYYYSWITFIWGWSIIMLHSLTIILTFLRFTDCSNQEGRHHHIVWCDDLCSHRARQGPCPIRPVTSSLNMFLCKWAGHCVKGYGKATIML